MVFRPHRILQQVAQYPATLASGIVKADETFFLESLKEKHLLPRPARRRGGIGRTRGTSLDQIAVLVVRDRCGEAKVFRSAGNRAG